LSTNMPPSPTPPVPPAPTLPLTPQVRAAYQDLYDKYEDAIHGTTDPVVLEALIDSKDDVDDVLTKDDMYHIEQNTAIYDALLGQINDTNTNLKALKVQIAAVASHIATAGAIIGAIDKVLGLVGVV
jgi:hypothetical protein